MRKLKSRLIKKIIFLLFLMILVCVIACSILIFAGLKIFMICGAIFAGFVLLAIAAWLNDNGKLDTSKIIIFILIYVGAMMAGFSYYLAYIERNEIAESLAKAALIELVAPSVMIFMKSLIENLSMNNCWPDKAPCEKKDSDTTSEI